MQVKQSVTKLNPFAYTTVKLSDSTILLVSIAFAALSFLLTLKLPAVGEEAVYANITLEMLYDQDYLVPKLFGSHYSRPPLFNWLMLGVAKFTGPVQILLAARIVNLSATFATAILLFSWVRNFFPAKNLALLSTAIFFSGDLLLKRGWIAYSDSLFSFFIFGSIIYLWLALEREQNRWLCVAGLFLCAGFLTKIHTVYIFYAVSGMVLCWFHPQRNFLFKPTSILLHTSALLFPVLWTYFVNDGYGGVATTWLQSRPFLAWPGLIKFIFRTTILFPADLSVRLFPASLLVIFYWYQFPNLRSKVMLNKTVVIVFWIVLLNLLPYWLAPNSNTRYILPLYPFMSILMGYVLWQAGSQARNLIAVSLLALVLFKYILAFWWFPYEHSVYRGNAVEIAQDILQRTKGKNLYNNNSASSGLRVALELNKLRYPAAPLVMSDNLYCGYGIFDRFDVHFGELIETYALRNEKLFLMFSTRTC